MPQTILVPFGGSQTDASVFFAACAVARTVPSHMEFYHIEIDPVEAAYYMPHADFVTGLAIADLLKNNRIDATKRSETARKHFESYCEQEKIRLLDQPDKSDAISAAFVRDTQNPVESLLMRARHRDLVVMARAHTPNGLPADILESLIVASGRPILIAPDGPCPRRFDTVMVGWKETPESARAVSAAMPFLSQAKRVFLVTVCEKSGDNSNALADIVKSLAWRGIAAEPVSANAIGHSASEILLNEARSLDANLLVLGAYSRSRTRELLFGGVTQAAVQGAEVPILIVH